MPTLLDAMNLARIWVGERGTPPEVFTDAFLIPIGIEAYRDIQRLFVKFGAPLSRTYAVFNVASGSQSPTSPPSDIIRPIRLWEQPQTGTPDFSAWVPMERADPELIPRPAEALLTHWEWSALALRFVGATSGRTVRIFYYAYLADLVDQTSDLLIPDSVGAMSFAIAAGAGLSRGSVYAKDAEQLYQGTVTEMLTREQGALWTPETAAAAQ